jgi:Cu/Ag efflux protein CusF
VYFGKPNWFSLLAFILIAGLLGGCDVENQSIDESKYTKKVRGEINSIKPDARKLVLKPASSQQGENTTEQGEGVIHFKLAQDATVTVLGKGAQLEDLKAGQQAEVQYFVQDETNRAGSVKVTEQPLVAKTAAGEFKKVKLDRKKIWLKPSSQGQGEGGMSLKLAPNVKVTVLGKEAQLEDLKAGQQGEIAYTVEDEKNEAQSVKVTKQPPVVKTATGEIKKVKLDRKKIILKPSSQEQGEGVMVFKVTQNATVTQNGQDAEFADVKAGQQAEIQYFAQDGINRADSVKIGETAAVSDPTPG